MAPAAIITTEDRAAWKMAVIEIDLQAVASLRDPRNVDFQSADEAVGAGVAGECVGERQLAAGHPLLVAEPAFDGERRLGAFA